MNTRLRLLRVALLVLAIAGIVLGAMNGEVHTVVNKAINVCLQCIGIG
ncbi:CD1871A family CXXC motif-containing protein [Candidatus Cryosericum septentrionale]|uniref:Thioredoxin n=1 Tax=Candidatus Cryosericum septentrionale TaxID=2290913 RepID=A0A398E1Y0_9BACT|nr:CD1871A family CXXC motif-containing protein [Candidatus Cryosericum septentrionale]RIE17584.1 thioredoxin [Candidatus Cryosericum septentrionale]